MANGFREIMTQADWKALAEDVRQFEIYRMLVCLDSRLCKMEKRPWFNKSLAFLGGVFGGIAAACGIKFL